MKEFFDDLWEDNKVVCVFIIGCIMITLFITMFTSLNDHSYTATITDKVRDNDNDNNRYLIFTELEDGSVLVLENTDSFLRGKFDSSDVYGDLKIGETYEFNVVGIRIPYMSWYENIISYELVENEETELTVTDTGAENHTYIIDDLNEKLEYGFSVVMIVDNNELTASDTFVFTEEILSEYSTMVDYDNKTIILTKKS